MEYYLSSNNKNYFLIATINNDIDPKIEQNVIKKFQTKILSTEARYVKVKAYNFGKLPQWHQRFGMGDAFFFIDEISI